MCSRDVDGRTGGGKADVAGQAAGTRTGLERTTAYCHRLGTNRHVAQIQTGAARYKYATGNGAKGVIRGRCQRSGADECLAGIGICPGQNYRAGAD